MERRGSPGLGPRNDGASRIQKPETAVDKAAKLAALKARVSAAIGSSKAKGGLNVGLHPALEDLGQWKPGGKSGDSDSKPSFKPSSNQTKQKKALDLSGPSAEEIKSNPYYDANLGAPTVKPRQSRQLIFNQKGKYIQQANALRRQAALEALKKKIAAQTRKAGIDEDIDVEKNFVVEAPPEIEWWDEGLVVGGDYDHIDDPGAVKIDTEDTIITSYIQHPVAIEPPQDQHLPAPKPMYLTSQEQAKLRRQRRMADLKEEQAKIRLGLVPAPPPKIKKGNLMRVLGEEAVKDPTAVEARVNKEIADRHTKHVETNEERKLTKEQKHEKLARNQEKDVAKGVHMLAFKVNSLANGQHRFKISKNAEQHNLKGLVIMHPKQNLIIVEGGEHSIRQYKKLMLNRIDWTENAPPRDRTAQNDGTRDWLRAEDEKGELKDLALNKCQLLFEGEVKSQAFHAFKSRVCETDAEARQALSRAKLESFWNMAKSTT
ncbi:pre-mRNA processing factor 3-domain-containing protein [Xylaria bambusicola]|uniref:pre-mRNA processing factor 3-domain-containing protein n=1 Tax=Xylaria bambusicola TaxID=326684 RepID=UPI002008E71E|nr:pre-mRNA processing factor 3-domain-containing protein [Xylaria bambusicola]KAI0518576.1 pre-mRNA processing factor 3-domain-containing protein [Xylaria bambusicola]